MADFAWPTPNTPSTGFICRRLLIPNGVDWISNVAGALLPLTYANNFFGFGTETPANTAALYQTMFDDFSLEIDRSCRLIGEIVPYAGATSPEANWLLCDGASYLRSTYPDLFAVIGTAYGSVDGTHFNVPDLQGRAPIGIGTGSGLTPRALGDSIGAETHTLITAEQATHTHADTGHTHVEGTATPTVLSITAGVPIPSAIPGVGITGVGNANLVNSGGNGSHNNMQPSLAINFLIVAL